MPNQIVFLSRNRDVQATFRGGVSLHGHTRHSRENLEFLGRFLQEHGRMQAFIARHAARCKRESGITLDFRQAYWTPPLCEQLAYAVELRQIEDTGLRPMVSLSDHNNIEAATLLRRSPGLQDVPISVEWTVPFGQAVFHIGIHNVPGKLATELMATLREATARLDERRICGLLSELSEIPSLLLVFNHPVWNLNGIPQDVFERELKRFLGSAGGSLHAVELNGMRNHEENRRALGLAAELGYVVVSGGDRHACEPNAMLNLTNAADFTEFVAEVRNGQSTVLVMPQYEEPLGWRIHRGFTHVIQEYPELPEGYRRWDDRTFHPNAAGEVLPLSKLWPGGPPAFIKTIFALSIAAARMPIRRGLRALTSKSMEGLRPMGDLPLSRFRSTKEPLTRQEIDQYQ